MHLLTEIPWFSFSIFRKGIVHCVKFKTKKESNETDEEYEKPDVTPECADVVGDMNDQYAELDDPRFAGYEIPIENQSRNLSF